MKLEGFLILVIVLSSCSGTEQKDEHMDSEIEHSMEFVRMTSEETGIEFSNIIAETDSFNFFKYEYIYNGGGVAVGDINNDGLEDIYFTGNQVSDKLYLNKGGLKFEDITDSAIGLLASEGWHTGVLMEDINRDGYLDIYVSRSGLGGEQMLGNLLFINRGNNTFAEEAAAYGVDVKRATTQSAFFDMDNDGDLDLYVMNHPYNTANIGEAKKTVYEVNEMVQQGSPFSDVLLENRDGKFVDITKAAGVNNHAFGLGLAISDINQDGLADIYVSNDYMAPDYLYINKGDGTFEDHSQEQLGHMSNFSMGNDIADFNNDGLVDIMTVDMVSEDHVRSKKNMGGMSTSRFWEVVKVGYHYQYMFNCLHLNNGNSTFSEVAQMAGVSKTDWSWAPLFADFDNDGFKDLFVSNGYRRDTRDNDYASGYNPKNKKVESFQDALNMMPQSKIENYMFRNKGDMTFEKTNVNWKTEQLINTNGAAYADFDNDGDLDIVLNNIDDPAFILRNDLKGNGYLRFTFTQPAQGATVSIELVDGEQFQEFRTVRGYQSSVSHYLHFGIGQEELVEKVIVTWPNGKQQILTELGKNQTIELSMAEASTNKNVLEGEQPLFEREEIPGFVHQQIVVNDFQREVLLPNKMSQLGPFMSQGDVNRDGHEDFYVSGSRGFSGKLFLGAENGFSIKPGPWVKEKEKEEQGSVIFDADGDQDLDLYVVSGSNEYKFDSPIMQDQLYINDGAGNFTNESDRLPKMVTSGQRVVAGDYDNDGDMDLFIGGRQTPGFYPFAPRSYLLRNDAGTFVEVTPNSPDLMGPGMITDLEFVDLDADKDLDLVCVGEWMAPSFFRNDGGIFKNISTNYITSDEIGWWSALAIDDLNGDGRLDFVFGNLGFNNKFRPDHEHPLEIYTHDFDKNGSYDIVLGKYQDGTCYPVRGKQCSSEQMPFISHKFPTYGEFAIANLEGIYGIEDLDKSLHYSATQFGSMLLLSKGDLYEKKLLPNQAQMGPLNAILIDDFTGDNIKDIVAVGNNFAAEVETMRYDGGRGVLLSGDGKGNFAPLNPNQSGFFVNEDAKDMIQIGKTLIVSSNADQLILFKRLN